MPSCASAIHCDTGSSDRTGDDASCCATTIVRDGERCAMTMRDGAILRGSYNDQRRKDANASCCATTIVRGVEIHAMTMRDGAMRYGSGSRIHKDDDAICCDTTTVQSAGKPAITKGDSAIRDDTSKVRGSLV